MSKTSAQRIKTAERRAFVLRLRKAGRGYRDIAAAVHQKFSPDELPRGYDERQAHQDVKRELERLGRLRRELAEEILQLELERLDALQSGIWDKARSGDFEAIDRVLKIIQQRARLLGSVYQEDSGSLAPVSVVEIVKTYDESPGQEG